MGCQCNDLLALLRDHSRVTWSCPPHDAQQGNLGGLAFGSHSRRKFIYLCVCYDEMPTNDMLWILAHLI